MVVAPGIHQLNLSQKLHFDAQVVQLLAPAAAHFHLLAQSFWYHNTQHNETRMCFDCHYVIMFMDKECLRNAFGYELSIAPVAMQLLTLPALASQE